MKQLLQKKMQHINSVKKKNYNYNFRLVHNTQHDCSKCLLCPPGDADGSLAKGWVSKRENEREREREREKEREDRRETGLNRERVLQTPTDAGTDQTPPWPEHTLLPYWGARSPRRRDTTGSWGQRSGVGQMALFLFCLLPEMTKKIKSTVLTRERTTKMTEHWPADWWRDGQEGGMNGSPPAVTPSRGKSDSYVGV